MNSEKRKQYELSQYWTWNFWRNHLRGPVRKKHDAQWAMANRLYEGDLNKYIFGMNWLDFSGKKVELYNFYQDRIRRKYK